MDKFNHIKTVFTIHNIAYQGKYGMDILEDTCGIGARDAHIVEYDGCANFMKGGLPVVAVDDIRLKVGIEQGFQNGAGEESKTLAVIIEAIQAAALKVIFVSIK